MTAATATPEVRATHGDRPAPKLPLRHLRIVPWMVGGKQMQAWEYDTPVPAMHGGKPGKVTNQVVIEEPDPRCFAEPLHVFGFYVLQLAADFWAMQAQVDGLNARIDDLATENQLQKGEITKLTNQLAESQRQLKSKNGKTNV